MRRQMLALALLLACLCSACLAANGDVQLEMGRLKPLVNAHVAEQWKFKLPEYVLQQSFIGQVGAPPPEITSTISHEARGKG